MFSALRQGTSLYILEKGDTPILKIGQCVNTLNNFSSYLPGSIDVSVKVGEELLEFKQLPSTLSVATYNGNTIISDNKELMSLEVENMIRISKLILDSVPIHLNAVKEGEKILKLLNPQFAQLKQQEEKISNLETKVGSMESKIDDIAAMLTKALQNDNIRN